MQERKGGGNSGRSSRVPKGKEFRPKSKRRSWVGGAADHPEGESGMEVEAHGDLWGDGDL